MRIDFFLRELYKIVMMATKGMFLDSGIAIATIKDMLQIGGRLSELSHL